MTHPSEPTATYRDALVFSYPASWRSRRVHETTSFTDAIVNFSTQPMHAVCHTKHNAKGIETDCGWPVRQLRASGVLVQWDYFRAMGGLFQRQRGRHIRLDGHAAIQGIERPGLCGAVGATETIETTIKAAPADVRVTACIRGPGVAQRESQVQMMLTSLHLTGSSA